MGAMLVRHEARSASAVRHELALDLDGHGVDRDGIDAATLVASELVGNAVRHTSACEDDDLDVGWTVHNDTVLISVEDPSTDVPVLRHPALDATSGRGLSIVEALTTDWGFEHTPRGKRVWAKVRVRASRLRGQAAHHA